MRVFLAEPNTRFDLSTLEVYGPIEYLSRYQLNPFNVEACLKVFKEGLKDFDPSEDYICMTGNMQTVALMLAMAYSLFPVFRILSFDARNSNYKERVIEHV